MFTIYVYVLDTLADWEPGYVTSELNSGRFFKKGAQPVSLKTVSYSKEPINTMGGMTIVPNCLIEDIVVSETSVLLLPGAGTWNDQKHGAIIEKAREFLSLGAMVCAICGATAALAGFGLLDKRPHTSNGPGFLEMVSPGYKGQSFYIDKPSVADNTKESFRNNTKLWPAKTQANKKMHLYFGKTLLNETVQAIEEISMGIKPEITGKNRKT